MDHIDWGVVAAFIAPLISTIIVCFGVAAWFVRVQIRLVTNAMEARLSAVEKGFSDMQKTVTETALTLARVEGKLSSSPLVQPPPAALPN